MNDRKLYRVREGVAWVNGTRVPDTRIVELTEAEARFDLDQGRLEADIGDLRSQAAAVEEDIAATEASIARGARRSKARFKLSEGGDGGV